ncbi:MAG: ATP-binding protein [Bacteroidia bacterium]
MPLTGPISLPALLVLVILSIPCLILAQYNPGTDSVILSLGSLSFNEKLTRITDLADSLQEKNGPLSHDLARHALAMARSANNQTAQVDALGIIGAYFFYRDQTDSAIFYFLAALQLADPRTPVSERAFLHVATAACYQTQGNVEAAIQQYEKALDLNLPDKETSSTFRNVFHNVARIYMEQGEFLKAASMFRKSLAISEARKDTSPIINTQILLGDAYREAKKYDSAFYFLRHTQPLIFLPDYHTEQIYLLNNLGAVFLDSGVYDSATLYFNRMMPLIAGQEDSAYSLSMVHYNLGRIEKENARYQSAISHFEQAKHYAHLSQLPDRILYALRELQETLALSQNFEAAYKVQAQYVQLKDSLSEIEGRERLERLTAKLQLQQKEMEKSELVYSNRIRTILLLLTVFSLISVLIITLVVVQRYRAKLTLNRMLSAQNQKITEQSASISQQNFRLEKSIHELHELAFIVSHNLREPLRRIGSYTSLLEMRYGSKLPPEATEFMNYTLQGVRDLKLMLDELLNYVVIGIEHHELSPVDFGMAISSVEEKISQLMPDTDVQVQILNPLPVMTSNRELVETIFFHLIQNSVKFRSGKPPVITISSTPVNSGYQFSVKDNGRGIDPMSIEKVFSLFYKGIVSDESGGTGIGLSICKKIVNYHHGEIWAESTPGQGATFHFTLSPLDQ